MKTRGLSDGKLDGSDWGMIIISPYVPLSSDPSSST